MRPSLGARTGGCCREEHYHLRLQRTLFGVVPMTLTVSEIGLPAVAFDGTLAVSTPTVKASSRSVSSVVVVMVLVAVALPDVTVTDDSVPWSPSPQRTRVTVRGMVTCSFRVGGKVVVTVA